MVDKYDMAIEYLVAHETEIDAAWDSPTRHTAGCLFQYAGNVIDDPHIGCLTQIRAGERVAQTRELTLAIQNDDRLPKCVGHIHLGNLHIFAEWQRKIDLIRTPLDNPAEKV